ncbi:hypothetical protein KC19_1G024700 [Ceratodon purpureus]|uniref:Uncharacterized protein n=1 Tax=Ceratodon purpureus TaxID=3225 RepID=A0A8T0J3Q6_CERPU|nr:hypothetical protein KC19_1G024700 [Ceratodon purpureus]
MPVSNDNQNELRRSLLEAREIDQREPEQPDNGLEIEEIHEGIEHSDIHEEIDTSPNQGPAKANSDYQWELDFHNNPGKTDSVKKIQCIYYYWGKDFKNTEKKASNAKNDMKGSWTDIYALVGFFSVFQGVLFESATQLATESCRFSVIPVTLSVVGSAASIAAAWYKLLEVQEYYGEYIKARRRSKILQTRIKSCKKAVAKGELVDRINFNLIEQEATKLEELFKPLFDKQFNKIRFLRGFLLIVFFVFAFLLAGSIYALICDEYY